MVQLKSHRLFFAGIGIVTIAIILTQATAFYYAQRSNSDASPSGCSVFVCSMINFGNSTVRWYNESSIPSRWNFYNLTLFITNGNVTSEFYPSPLNEHLVTSIEGVRNAGQVSWALWIFCGAHNAWAFSNVGADEINLVRGETLAWAYTTQHSPPIAGSKTVSSCP
jgi:hypothetical protein